MHQTIVEREKQSDCCIEIERKEKSSVISCVFLYRYICDTSFCALLHMENKLKVQNKTTMNFELLPNEILLDLFDILNDELEYFGNLIIFHRQSRLGKDVNCDCILTLLIPCMDIFVHMSEKLAFFG